MRRPFLLLSAVAFALTLVLSSCGDATASAVARVNGVAITQDDLDDELDAILANERYLELIERSGTRVAGSGKGTFDLAFVDRVLTRQILLELISREVERRDLEITDADLQAAEAQVANDLGGPDVFRLFPESYRRLVTRRTAEVTKLQEALAGSTIDDAAVREFYEQNPDQFAQTCVSHILFAVPTADGNDVDREATAARSEELRAQAAAGKARIDGGEDFAAVARELSKDPSNAQQGGDLGCNAGPFVQEFEDAVAALPTGQVSEPVQTEFGWHLIKVTSRDPKTLEEATPEIRQQLVGDAQAQLSDFVRQAVDDADVWVNPRYGRWDKDGAQPGVVPPSAPTTTRPGDTPPDNPLIP